MSAAILNRCAAISTWGKLWRSSRADQFSGIRVGVCERYNPKVIRRGAPHEQPLPISIF